MNAQKQPPGNEAGSLRKVALPCLLLAIILIALTSGCTQPAGIPAGDRLVVAVTIPPQEEMVRAVAGDRVDVLVMVPPGSDPHSYEPSPQQIAEASRASVYLAIGKGLLPVEDTLTGRLKSLNPSLVVVDTSSGIDYLGSGNSRDPHVWLSLKNAVIMVTNIEQAFIMTDPSHEPAYEKGAGDYIGRIEDLDRTINGFFSGKENRTIIASHPAWGYFARDYNLTIIAIEEEGKEPTPKDLEALVERARKSGVTVIFADALENRRNAEVVAAEIGATVETVNPLPADYLANMDQTGQLFARSLSG
ncbi:MAG: zinc ABC transporter solute-binding protein [Methanoregulaceae archaeon]|nr:zinc ABC transporter solute-binding protein [Methanoregulaceae archaeon]